MVTERPAISGLLACDKPIGMTSRDCVNIVVKLLREKFPKPTRLPKVGHAGTLDPLATGVLVMGIGMGVRLVPYIQQMAKQYDATFRFGWWTDSGDLDGELHQEQNAIAPTLETIQTAVASLIGNITQTPPSTSAIKVGGIKAYKLAHRGVAVVVPARIVRIDSITIKRYEYPEIDLSIQCGSGTYIRTLGMDLAVICKTRAVMSRLQRTKIGNFELEACHSLERLNAQSIGEALQPLAIGVAHMPEIAVNAEQLARLMKGQKIDMTEIADDQSPTETEVTVHDMLGNLRVIVRKVENLCCPYRVFPQE